MCVCIQVWRAEDTHTFSDQRLEKARFNSILLLKFESDFMSSSFEIIIPYLYSLSSVGGLLHLGSETGNLDKVSWVSNLFVNGVLGKLTHVGGLVLNLIKEGLDLILVLFQEWVNGLEHG